MLKFTTASAFLALSLMAGSSAAAIDYEGVYATIGGTLLSTELDLSDIDVADQNLDLGSEDADILLINGRLGYRFNAYFAVEGELGFGLGGDDVDRVIPLDVLGNTVDVDTNVDLNVDNYYIAFARGIYPISEDFDIFARIGYGQATADADVVGNVAGLTAEASASANESGFAYGVGGQYNLTQYDGIRADYTRLEDMDIISLAYSRRF